MLFSQPPPPPHSQNELGALHSSENWLQLGHRGPGENPCLNDVACGLEMSWTLLISREGRNVNIILAIIMFHGTLELKHRHAVNNCALATAKWCLDCSSIKPRTLTIKWLHCIHRETDYNSESNKPWHGLSVWQNCFKPLGSGEAEHRQLVNDVVYFRLFSFLWQFLKPVYGWIPVT